MAERLYIIDGHSQIFRAYYSPAGRRSVRGKPVGAVYIFTRMLMKLIRQHKPDYLVCVLDPKGPTFRNEIFPAYKANRDEMPEDLREQMPVIENIVRAFGIPLEVLPGFEADDVIATLAKQGAKQGLAVRMVSRDKDLKQLLEPEVLLINADDDSTYGLADLKAEFGLSPEQYTEMQALAGDSVDNVPGAKGIGPKTAAELIREHGSLQAVLDHAPQIKQPKRRENLLAFVPEAELSRKLVTLRTDLDLKLDREAARLHPPQREKLLPLLRDLNFQSVIKELGWDDGASPAPEADAPAPAGKAVARKGGQQSLFGNAPAAAPAPVAGALAATPGSYRLVADTAALKALTGRLKGLREVGLHCAADGPGRLAGVALAFAPGDAVYVHATTGLTAAQVLEALGPALRDSAVTKIGHDLKADARILLAEGLSLAGIGGDTKLDAFLIDGSREDAKLASLAREYLGLETEDWDLLFGPEKTRKPLRESDPEAVCRYAAQFADFALRVNRVLAPRLVELELDKLAAGLELPLIAVLARMEHRGIRVDKPYLRRLSDEFAGEIATLEAACHGLAGREFNIGSPKQLAEVLYDELKLPEQGRTAKGTGRSTDQDALETLSPLHALPAKVLEWRHLSKLKSTYVDQLQELADAQDRVHTTYRQTVATGRLSSKDPNLQNIPVRTDTGRRIRRAFIAAPGQKLVSADYSQIELRILAHIADEPHMIAAFHAGEDIHKATAAAIFGAKLKDVTKQQRDAAKTVNYGVLYGQGAFGLAQQLGIPRADAQDFIDRYFSGHPRVKALTEQVLELCRAQGFVTTLMGRRRYLPEIASRNVMLKRQAERQAFNTVLQGTAADLIKKAMLDADRLIEAAGLPYSMLLQVHDELVFEAPAAQARDCAEFVRRVMGRAMELKVPLTVDAGVGDNWLEAK
ncbi:MAG: DNA polymerase I [Planctomycetes bacterium]|nr:DNA polymerase I [Planctomycetota bacterium]